MERRTMVFERSTEAGLLRVYQHGPSRIEPTSGDQDPVCYLIRAMRDMSQSLLVECFW